MASTLTVKAVRMRSLFCAVISGSWSRSRSGPVSGTQITPLVCLIMNAIRLGVILLAATMMSPSFSRLASSTTTTGRPAAMSATARSTLSSGTGPGTGRRLSSSARSRAWPPAAGPAGTAVGVRRG